MAVALTASVWLSMHGCADRPGPPSGVSLEQWELDPTPLMEIGRVEGSPEVVFAGINGIGLFDDGGVVVSNSSSATLRVFDAQGRFERELGGEGQGPGEFAYLGGVLVLVGDTVLAYDPVAYRLSSFSRSGEALNTVQIAAVDGAPEVYLGRDGRGRHLISSIRPTPREATSVTADPMEVRRYGAEGTEWVSLGTFAGMRRIRSPVPLSPHLVGAVLGDTAFVTDGLTAEVTALSPTGSSTRIIDASASPWTPSEARELLEQSVADPALAQRLREVGGGPSWDSVPRFSDALADPTGALWLKQYDPRTDSHWVGRRRTGGRWIVTATGGRRVAEVVLPDDVRLMVVGRDRVAGVRVDELEVERVVVYSLRRGRSRPAAP